MTSPKIRVGPWDCDQALHSRIKELRLRMGGQSWTWALHQGLKLLEEKHGGVIPAAAGSVSPAAVVPAAVVPAAVVPAAPQSESERVVTRLRQLVADYNKRIADAKMTLERDPESRQGDALLRTSLVMLPRLESDLVEAEKVLAAELSALSVDNGGNGEEV